MSTVGHQQTEYVLYNQEIVDRDIQYTTILTFWKYVTVSEPKTNFHLESNTLMTCSRIRFSVKCIQSYSPISVHKELGLARPQKI
jgi:hypothetical protein